READIYALVIARPGEKPGPALKPSTQDCSPQAIRALGGGSPPPAAPTGQPAVFCGMQFGPGRIGFGGFPMSFFANGIAGQVGRVVVDRTGLAGNWDFELRFAPELPVGLLPPGGDAPSSDPGAPSIFTAIQEQLGLKLQATKGSVKVLVIDSVERPIGD
ncbi:MAG TPA: TIGR03435 family protein, partial [Geobacteraceae bacterium]|nr:TIGR03435 family protein [Geobacteraceae bacterium]